MRQRKRRRIIGVVFSLFILHSQLSIFAATPTGVSSEMNVAVEIKERLILKIYSGAKAYEAKGYSQASITTPFQMEDSPVFIEVWARSPQNRGVQLLVNQIPMESQMKEKDTEAPAEIGWQATGNGFCNGLLSKTTPQIMGSWSGSGKYEGTVSYHYLGSQDNEKNDQTHTIHYCLVAL